MKNSNLDKNFRDFENFGNFENLEKCYQDLRFFIGKNSFSSEFLVFLKTSLVSSTHTKYERITLKTHEVMIVFIKILCISSIPTERYVTW